MPGAGHIRSVCCFVFSSYEDSLTKLSERGAATPVRCDNSHQAAFPPPVRTRFVPLDDGEDPRLTTEAC